MDQFWWIFNNPLTTVAWKALIASIPVFLGIFLVYYRRKIKQEGRKLDHQEGMLKAIGEVQATLKFHELLHGQTGERLERLEDNVFIPRRRK